jgi:hypothetical protein
MSTRRAPAETLRDWFAERLPDGLFDEPVKIVFDREEITVIGSIAAPTPDPGASEIEQAVAIANWIKTFRERTRQTRIEIASDAEHIFGRKVSWGVTCGDITQMFSTLSIPVMTRLRQSERRLLDTLVDAGVARSRSDALGWCVRQVGEHTETWLSDLREAMRRVEEVRDAGPHTQ